ncbi:dihydrofolate synthase / folylpolyglutamate synthase [Alkalithermobacter thermoalcaliphilus JW-YL-7 = DSM 7308]|uniref:tetrahydrofolate synthase n=1 Tax=Alkalithermobacter thermoalcaliphilus JW-YL-7 = DSM 7308 TaxID=1121328 RepID=A0A150FRT7_CLOPD|nr:FolC bifunctional protein [[Clostridium] paradoxum JW-YL-7 = DSM 7308]SHK38889.1 dihydrofolate synthase / folylpolyglutamate synthase [[Clostridium] paradoxum JW-YL-7 = DSM 7308]
MKYAQALDFIYGASRFGIKLGLDNITKLLDLLGNPHKNLKVIHVAGTNGKGSTSSFITSILKNAGYTVGLFTSPHLEEFTERIRINGENIKQEDLARITCIVKDKIDEMINKGYNHPTQFEIITAIALYYYNEKNVDFVVLEVGMGGRFDSTNVIENPLLCVITPISMDHKDELGDTIEKIAYHKAGIIKHGCDVVVYPQEKEAQKVIMEEVNDKNACVYIADIENKEIIESSIDGQVFNFKLGNEYYKNVNIKLLGDHQVNNAIVAVSSVDILRKKHGIKIDNDHIYNGLRETRWAGRIEILVKEPTVIIDGAHNEDGAYSLAKAMDKYFSDKNITFVLGMLKDKDADKVIEILMPKTSRIITTRPNSDRSLSAYELKEKIDTKTGKQAIAIENIKDAIEYAVDTSKENDVVICAGSLYMIGEVRSLIKDNKKKKLSF